MASPHENSPNGKQHSSELSKKPSMMSTENSSMVRVKVGPTAKVFTIHKDLLCSQSDYFKCCFEGPFKEASEGLVTLDDEEPTVFDRFNHWLYTGKMLNEGEDLETISWEHLCKTYVFADKRLVLGFQNRCIDAMIERHAILGTVPPPPIIQYIWENTAESAPLRTFFVDLWARRANLQVFLTNQANVELLSKEFLASVAVAFYNLTGGSSVTLTGHFWEKRCKYHVHGENEACGRQGVGLSEPEDVKSWLHKRLLLGLGLYV